MGRPRKFGLAALYAVTTDDQSQQQVGALPAEALAAFAEARTMLEVSPWGGVPYHKTQAGQSHVSPDVRPGRAG